MKLDLDIVLEDYRESTCERCLEEDVSPIYRFCYSSSVEDINENPIIGDVEIQVCRSCCSKIKKNWRQYIDN